MSASAEQTETRRGSGYAHGAGTVRVTDIRISAQNHAFGRNKRHREHADRLLEVSELQQ